MLLSTRNQKKSEVFSNTSTLDECCSQNGLTPVIHINIYYSSSIVSLYMDDGNKWIPAHEIECESTETRRRRSSQIIEMETDILKKRRIESLILSWHG